MRIEDVAGRQIPVVGFVAFYDTHGRRIHVRNKHHPSAADEQREWFHALQKTVHVQNSGTYIT